MILLMGVARRQSMQGKMLADDYGHAWISTGEIFRVLITGKRRKEMLEGKLLSDEEVINVVDKVLELIDTKEEFVLDGFPRTIPQADWLMEQVRKGKFPLTAVVHLTASEEVVRERLLERGRQDDTEAAIAKRFGEYRSATVPIIEHFRQIGAPVCDINAAQEPRSVHDAILRCVESKTNK